MNFKHNIQQATRVVHTYEIGVRLDFEQKLKKNSCEQLALNCHPYDLRKNCLVQTIFACMQQK